MGHVQVFELGWSGSGRETGGDEVDLIATTGSSHFLGYLYYVRYIKLTPILQ